MLIVEDLHHIEDTHVTLSLARVVQASRQHGHEVHNMLSDTFIEDT